MTYCFFSVPRTCVLLLYLKISMLKKRTWVSSCAFQCRSCVLSSLVQNVVENENLFNYLIYLSCQNEVKYAIVLLLIQGDTPWSSSLMFTPHLLTLQPNEIDGNSNFVLLLVVERTSQCTFCIQIFNVYSYFCS